MKWICEKCGIKIEACTKWRCTDQVEHKWIKLSNHGVTGSHQVIVGSSSVY